MTIYSETVDRVINVGLLTIYYCLMITMMCWNDKRYFACELIYQLLELFIQNYMQRNAINMREIINRLNVNDKIRLYK